MPHLQITTFQRAFIVYIDLPQAQEGGHTDLVKKEGVSINGRQTA
jgi:hypothetical protein